jgi:hypothetical protein
MNSVADSIRIAKLSGFGRGKDQTFEKSSVSFGTDPNCDVRFDATWDKTVSPRHATIEKRSDGWWIIDQSRDGCWIDGRRVQQEKLQPGAVVELGKGGPRVRIDSGQAVVAAPSSFQTSKPELLKHPATQSVQSPSAPSFVREGTSPAARPFAPTAIHHGDGKRLAPWLALAALLVIAAIIGGVWITRKPATQEHVGFDGRDLSASHVGKVITTATAAPGAIAEWQPVVDMGEEIFPSFLVAAATMKESPFDALNDSPTRLGDKRGIVGVEIVNPTAHSKVRVELGENEIMRASTYEAELPAAGETYRIYPSPNYRFDVLERIKQTTPLSIAMSVSLNGTSLGQKAKTVRIASINDCPFAVALDDGSDQPKAVPMDWMFAAYVNENHPISDELRKEALKSGIVPAFMGYQGDADAVYKQVFAIWYVLQRRGVRYSNITTTPGASKEVYSQYVRFIDQSINNSQANCVDGSVLFASILRQIGIEPILVLVPGHMFVGFYVDADGQQVDFLETTMIGNLPSSTSAPTENEKSAGFGRRPSAIKGILEPATDTGAGDKDSLQCFVAAIKAAREEYGQYFGDAGTAEKKSLYKYKYKSQTVRKDKANCQAIPVAQAREMGLMPIGYQP